MTVVLLERPVAGVGVIRLNRPQNRNALNTEVRRLIAAMVQQLNEDDQIGAIVLTGGPDCFAVGADLPEQLTRDVVDAMAAYTTHAIWHSPKPVIAAVNGAAFGGGSELVLQCDIVIASETASFAQPEINAGFVPGGGATQRLPRVIGRQNALYALLTGRAFSAQEAHRMGYVAEVVEGDALPPALDLAAAIAAKPRWATRHIKEVTRLGLEASSDLGLALERRSWQLMFGTQDLKEGISAVIEGRKAQFTGR